MTVSRTTAGRRGRVDGERLVAEFEASDLGRKAFCEAQSIAVSTLDYWRKRLRGHAAAAGFVELTASADSSRFDIELDFGGGAVLRIRRSG